MKPLAFGWILPSGPATGRATYVQSVERGLALIQGHFDSAWMVDHLQFEQADLLEGWTASTYFAARTPDLLFGHTVLCQSYRNPALLAKMASTLQYPRDAQRESKRAARGTLSCGSTPGSMTVEHLSGRILTA